MKMLKLPNTEPLRKQNVYGSFGLDWLCSAEHFFVSEIGFDWVCIGFVLGLFSQSVQLDIFS